MSTPLRYERIYGKPTTRLVFILNLYPLFLFLIVCPEVEAMAL